MDWQARMNAAMDYIEQHLEDEMEWERAAAEAHCSPFHFLRMFEVITGISPGEYVRRRRLSLAALELAAGRAKVINVAMRLGYDSPDAFAKAFKRELGVTPSEAREPGVRLKTWPRFSFSVVLKGETPMDFRIMHKEVMRFTGLPLKTTTADGRQNTEIPAFWKETVKNGGMQKLCDSIPKGSTLGVMGISAADHDPGTGGFTYLIGIETPLGRSALPKGCIDITAAAGTWAIFEARGPISKALQTTIGRVYGEWFPTSGYERAYGPQLEIYPDGDGDSPDYYSELWVPVKKL